MAPPASGRLPGTLPRKRRNDGMATLGRLARVLARASAHAATVQQHLAAEEFLVNAADADGVPVALGLEGVRQARIELAQSGQVLGVLVAKFADRLLVGVDHSCPRS